MTYIDWMEHYELGIPSMDRDHRILAAALERVLEALAKAVPAEQVADVLDAFAEEAAGHFQREEELLDRANYADLPAHRAEHERLLAQLRHLRQRVRDGLLDNDDGSRTAAYLRDWLLRHIREDDAAYKSAVTRLF